MGQNQAVQCIRIAATLSVEIHDYFFTLIHGGDVGFLRHMKKDAFFVAFKRISEGQRDNFDDFLTVEDPFFACRLIPGTKGRTNKPYQRRVGRSWPHYQLNWRS